MQSTELSEGLLLLVVGGPGWCTLQAGAVEIGVLDPKKMASECGIGTQCRNFGSRPFRSLLRAMPHRSSLYDSHTLWVTVPLWEPWVRVQEEDPVHWPFKRTFGFLAYSFLFQVESPLLFTARCHAGTSFQLWCSGLGIPAWVWDPHDFQGGPLQTGYSPSFSAYACGHWGQPFPHLCLSYQSICGFFLKSLAMILHSAVLQLVIKVSCSII